MAYNSGVMTEWLYCAQHHFIWIRLACTCTVLLFAGLFFVLVGIRKITNMIIVNSVIKYSNSNMKPRRYCG